MSIRDREQTTDNGPTAMSARRRTVTSTVPISLMQPDGLSPPHRSTKSGAPSFMHDNLRIDTSEFENKLKKISQKQTQNVYEDKFSLSNRQSNNNSQVSPIKSKLIESRK